MTDCAIVKDYAEICCDFKFYYPNGIPKDAQRTCIECIHLDESQLEKQKIRCSKIDREAKRAMWLYVMRDKGQSNLETFI